MDTVEPQIIVKSVTSLPDDLTRQDKGRLVALVDENGITEDIYACFQTGNGQYDWTLVTTGVPVSDFAETVRDTMGTALVAGTNVTITLNDGADTITIATGGAESSHEIIIDVTGDGITDNLTMIQNALNDAGTMVGDRYGRTVVLNVTGDVGVSAQLVIPKGVTLAGRGVRATRLLALAGFGSGYVVKMGAGASEFEHGIGVRDLIIDPNDLPGVGCVETSTANEPSYIERVLFRNGRGRAISAVAGVNLTPSHLRISDCEVFQSLANTATETFHFDGVGNTVLIERTTVTNMGDADAAGTRPTYGIRAIGTSVRLDAVHIEQAQRGVYATLGAGNGGRLTMTGITGHPSVDDLVYITDAVPVELIGVAGLGVTNVVNNTLTGEAITRRLSRYTNMAEAGTGRQINRLATSADLTVADHVDVVEVTAAFERNIILPTHTEVIGHLFVIKRVAGVANVRVNPLSTVLIDGQSEKRIDSLYGFVQCYFNGTNYVVTGQSGTITDIP